ncbi:MAG: acyltransferase [Ferruginibacter sp.]
MRGFAAMAVCFFHFTYSNANYFTNNNPVKIIGSYGHYGVEVFFVISGFVIPWSMHKGGYMIRHFKTFLLKRIIRIEPPYIISIVLVVLLGYISTLSPYYRGQPFHPDPVALLFHLGYLNAFFHLPWVNSAYWTLAIEFQYYILIALIFPLVASKKIYVWLGTIVAFNFILLLVPSVDLIFLYSFYFTLGIITYKYMIAAINATVYFIFIAVLLSLIFLKFDLPGFMAGLLPVLFVYSKKESKVGEFFGNISYSVYLLHVPIGGRIINLSENFVKTDLMRYVVLLLAMAVTIAFSYLFYKYIELPCKKMAHKIQYGDKRKEYIPVRA